MTKELKLEKWQIEINRLDKMRLDLGLSMYGLEKITGISRDNLKGMFDFKNIPSLKRYLEIKDALENQFNVVFIEENTKRTEVAIESDKCDCKLVNGLLRRGKIRCIKSKKEHNF
jgi:hypothetical protein